MSARYTLCMQRCVCKDVYVCMCVCVYVYVYILFSVYGYAWVNNIPSRLCLRMHVRIRRRQHVHPCHLPSLTPLGGRDRSVTAKGSTGSQR